MTITFFRKKVGGRVNGRGTGIYTKFKTFFEKIGFFRRLRHINFSIGCVSLLEKLFYKKVGGRNCERGTEVQKL